MERLPREGFNGSKSPPLKGDSTTDTSENSLSLNTSSNFLRTNCSFKSSGRTTPSAINSFNTSVSLCCGTLCTFFMEICLASLMMCMKDSSW
eukprot:5635506-Amphidinium_carterae.1